MAFCIKVVFILAVIVASYSIPIPPDQLLAWLVPEICPSDCPSIEIPVCGTDGLVYTNECFLKQANCSSNAVLNVQRFGTC